MPRAMSVTTDPFYQITGHHFLFFCSAYQQLNVKHEPLQLITPQFETPLPPLQPAVSFSPRHDSFLPSIHYFRHVAICVTAFNFLPLHTATAFVHVRDILHWILISSPLPRDLGRGGIKLEIQCCLRSLGRGIGHRFTLCPICIPLFILAVITCSDLHFWQCLETIILLSLLITARCPLISVYMKLGCCPL